MRVTANVADTATVASPEPARAARCIFLRTEFVVCDGMLVRMEWTWAGDGACLFLECAWVREGTAVVEVDESMEGDLSSVGQSDV